MKHYYLISEYHNVTYYRRYSPIVVVLVVLNFGFEWFSSLRK
jgi:hypothetical protein